MGYEIENAQVLQESQKGMSDEGAILVDAPDLMKPEWIPKNQITEESEVYEMGTEGSLIITEWLARKQGWI